MLWKWFNSGSYGRHCSSKKYFLGYRRIGIASRIDVSKLWFFNPYLSHCECCQTFSKTYTEMMGVVMYMQMNKTQICSIFWIMSTYFLLKVNHRQFPNRCYSTQPTFNVVGANNRWCHLRSRIGLGEHWKKNNFTRSILREFNILK